MFAYFVTWLYSGTTYLMLGIACCCVHLISKNKTVVRYGTQLTVSMVATSAAASATRAFVRRLELDPYAEFANIFLDICFYVYLVFVFCLQECIYRVKQKSCVLKCSLALGGCFFVIAAAPLFAMEWVLKKVEEKVLQKDQEKETSTNMSELKL